MSVKHSRNAYDCVEMHKCLWTGRRHRQWKGSTSYGSICRWKWPQLKKKKRPKNSNHSRICFESTMNVNNNVQLELEFRRVQLWLCWQEKMRFVVFCAVICWYVTSVKQVVHFVDWSKGNVLPRMLGVTYLYNVVGIIVTEFSFCDAIFALPTTSELFSKLLTVR